MYCDIYGRGTDSIITNSTIIIKCHWDTMLFVMKTIRRDSHIPNNLISESYTPFKVFVFWEN